jgi:hypothetical protein
MCLSLRHASAFVAANDSPLTGERAVTRVRSTMEGGDERAGWQHVGTAHGRSSHQVAVVAVNDAPLIGERANARALRNGRWRCPRESGVIRRAPASRTGSSGGNLDASAATRQARMLAATAARFHDPPKCLPHVKRIRRSSAANAGGPETRIAVAKGVQDATGHA